MFVQLQMPQKCYAEESQAPLSLAGALKDYLEDPNFEQNRIEYKLQKDSADKNGKAPVVSKSPGSDFFFIWEASAEQPCRARKVYGRDIIAIDDIRPEHQRITGAPECH
jgi:hypothetical protein